MTVLRRGWASEAENGETAMVKNNLCTAVGCVSLARKKRGSGEEVTLLQAWLKSSCDFRTLSRLHLGNWKRQCYFCQGLFPMRCRKGVSGRPWVLTSLKLGLSFWEEMKSVLPQKPAVAYAILSSPWLGLWSQVGVTESVLSNTETSLFSGPIWYPELVSGSCPCLRVLAGDPCQSGEACQRLKICLSQSTKSKQVLGAPCMLEPDSSHPHPFSIFSLSSLPSLSQLLKPSHLEMEW